MAKPTPPANEEPAPVVHLRSVPTAPAAPTTQPSSGNRRLLIGYGAACAALLAVLIGLIVYGFLIKKDPEVHLSAPSAETPTAATAPAGAATDGPLSFTINGMEIGPTVAMTDAPIEKTAVGEFIVVHMAVSNPGAEPSTFTAMFQTLHVGPTTYQVDGEATAYLGGTSANLPPGASQVVSIAFDVPPGTVPDSIELHADPTTPGVLLPLP